MEQTEEFIMDSNWHEVAETFDDMNLKQPLLLGIYSYGFEKPSAFQQKGIKPIILGCDTIAQAQSGTGKTAAFTIGMLELIDTSVLQCQALILVPTRELAQGIRSVILQIGQYLKINCHVCMGGTVFREDVRILEKGVHAVVGTPGRVLDMISRNHLSTQQLKIFILDETDEMLSRGFKDQIEEIFRHLPGSIQCCLFSTTMPLEILKLTNYFMRDPLRILVKKEEFTLEDIAQYYIPIEKEDWKFATLSDLYENLDIAQAIIYVNTRKKVETLSKQMIQKDFVLSFMHGEMGQTQRELIMKEFCTGSTRILITTDFLARGIDIQQVSLIVNFDMPTNYEKYLHRICRSGRFGRKCVVINFVTESDAQFLKDLKQHYNMSIENLPEDFSNLL